MHAFTHSLPRGAGRALFMKPLPLKLPPPHTHNCQLSADVFEDFHARWTRADPPNVMAFPPIFEEVKAATRRRLRAARGDLSLWALWS